MTAQDPLLVGVDGSVQSVLAASWAMREAELRQADVRLILLNDRPSRDDEVWATLLHMADRLTAERPHVRLHAQLARGNPATELVHRSTQAQLTVVGTRGRGPVTTTPLGSVSTRVATHGHSPVVVARELRTEGPVVVGLDGSPHSQAALRFAFDAAAERCSGILAVQVWREAQDEHPDLASDSPIDLEEHAEQVRCGLAEQLAGWREQYPHVPVRMLAQRGNTVQELVHAARQAQLLVVGHRGRGGFAGLLLGSVAAGVLRYSEGTVAVVRDSPRPPRSSFDLGVVRWLEPGSARAEPGEPLPPAVVVGVDGSPQSLEAADWAAAEAHRQHLPLHLLIAKGDPTRTESTKNTLREITRQCREQIPDLDASGILGLGHPVDELIHHSRRAKLVVVSSRGHGGFTNALLGSISRAVASHAECPVVVVRGTPASTAPVLVGVDQSPGAGTALDFAFSFAARRGVELIAMHVWHEEWVLAVPLSQNDQQRFQLHLEQSLADRIASYRAQYPNVGGRTLVQRGHPVAALTEAARSSQLLVVGRRGRGGFPGMFLGSVASGVLHHAHCPVAVLPIDGEDPP